jgi:hypothetical protein
VLASVTEDQRRAEIRARRAQDRPRAHYVTAFARDPVGTAALISWLAPVGDVLDQVKSSRPLSTDPDNPDPLVAIKPRNLTSV